MRGIALALLAVGSFGVAAIATGEPDEGRMQDLDGAARERSPT